MKTKIRKLLKHHSFRGYFWSLFAVALIGGLILEHPEIISGQFTKNAANPKSYKFEVPIPAASIEPTKEVVSKNNDPIVQCVLNECGTIEMKSSVCKISGCCIVGDQKIVLKDQNECSTRQKEYASNNSKSTSSQKNYILENAKITAKSYEREQCLEQAGREADECNTMCEGPWNYGRNACSAALEGLDWTNERYSECLNENSSIYGSCLDKCTNEMSAKGEKCLAN